MAGKPYPIYMPQEAWDYVNDLKKTDPEKGRGAFIAEILMQDKKKREKAQKAADKQPAA